jgi:outer membrane receptor protein involved in Fe transport
MSSFFSSSPRRAKLALSGLAALVLCAGAVWAQTAATNPPAAAAADNPSADQPAPAPSADSGAPAPSPAAPSGTASSAAPDGTTTAAAPAAGDASAGAAATIAPMDRSITHMSAVEVRDRSDELVGVADSATQGTIGSAELSYRPLLRAAEILETIPGMIITMHSGGGKAPQYFTRGFNLDHGTDFAIDLDGMGLNLASHVHGEGYADMNIVIPELIDHMDYEKGPYYAANGDFSNAGAAHIHFIDSAPDNFFKFEAGTDGFYRSVLVFSEPVKTGNLVLGLEAQHENGPWTLPDNYWKYNGFVRYSNGTPELGFSVTGMLYHGSWRATDQVSASAVDDGQISFYGNQDSGDGGSSERMSLQAEWHRQDADSATSISFFYFHYTLDLFSNFTYYLESPDGDEFEQDGREDSAGLKIRHTLFGTFMGKRMETSFGLQAQNYWINDGLYQTINDVRSNKVDYDGNLLPAVTKVDSILETQLGIYVENKVWWNDWFRTELGLRGDINRDQVKDDVPANGGVRVGELPSPKASMIFGPWDKTEFYVQGGYSFHSNDARSSAATVNPDGTSAGGLVPVLVPSYGYEVGVRSSIIPKLQSTLSLWWFHNKSELYFNGIDQDTGIISTSQQATRRYGAEWTNYYTPVDWLTFDLDLADSAAHFVTPTTAAEDPTPGGTEVDEAIHESLSGGVTVQAGHGVSVTLRVRDFGPRPLVSDSSYSSASTTIVNLGLAYRMNERWRFTCDILNLLDRKDHDIDYFYESRDTPGGPIFTGDHFHPVEPIEVRAGVQVKL